MGEVELFWMKVELSGMKAELSGMKPELCGMKTEIIGMKAKQIIAGDENKLKVKASKHNMEFGYQNTTH